MNKKILLIALFLCISFGLQAQIDLLSYDWEEEPETYTLTEEELKEPQVTVKYYKEIEMFLLELPDKTFQLLEMELEHKIIRLNNDEGIENNNKVYLPTNDLQDLKLNKARIIYPDGEIRELDEEDIMEATDDNGNVRMLYYAIEGVEKGVDLELVFARIYKARIYGNKISVQNEYTVKNATYKISLPDHLLLDFKCYNELEEFEHEEEDGKNIYTLNIDKVEPLKDESYSIYSSNIKSFLYKLGRNTYSNEKIGGFNELNEIYYNYIYETKLKSKVIKKFLGDFSKVGKSTDEIVTEIEKKVKNAILYVGSDGASEVKEVISTGKGSATGLTRLFGEIFTFLDIKHELVISSSKHYGHFEEEFECRYFLDDFLYYFPKTKRYLDPADNFTRYPYVGTEYLGNKGLFFKLVKMSDYTTASSKVKTIEVLPMDRSWQKLHVRADLSDFDEVKLEIKSEYMGYDALPTQGIYEYYDSEDQDETVEEYLNFADEEGEVEDGDILYTQPNDIGVNPLTVMGSLTSSKLIESAGNNYLFKIGAVIGTQFDLYDEDTRYSDIEIDHLHSYTRTIEFTIPEGYTAENLDSLNMSVHDGAKTLGFESSYVKEGDKIIVTVKEYYSELFYEKAVYDEFRKVVNAAADFNKITIVLKEGQYND
jgi:hypothetical protein